MSKLDIYRKFTNALGVTVVLSVAWICYEVLPHLLINGAHKSKFFLYAQILSSGQLIQHNQSPGQQLLAIQPFASINLVMQRRLNILYKPLMHPI